MEYVRDKTILLNPRGTISSDRSEAPLKQIRDFYASLLSTEPRGEEKHAARRECSKDALLPILCQSARRVSRIREPALPPNRAFMTL